MPTIVDKARPPKCWLCGETIYDGDAAAHYQACPRRTVKPGEYGARTAESEA